MGSPPKASNDHRDDQVNCLAQFFGFLDDVISPCLQRFTPARLILHPLDIDLLSNLLFHTCGKEGTVGVFSP